MASDGKSIEESLKRVIQRFAERQVRADALERAYEKRGKAIETHFKKKSKPLEDKYEDLGRELERLEQSADQEMEELDDWYKSQTEALSEEFRDLQKHEEVARRADAGSASGEKKRG